MSQVQFNAETCRLQHEHIIQRLDKHEEMIKENDDRISVQEQYKASSEVQINNLCERIDSLVTTIKDTNKVQVTVTISIMMTLIGFVIWYIQNR